MGLKYNFHSHLTKMLWTTVVMIPGFHCQGPGFNPWPGNQGPTSCMTRPKKKMSWTRLVLIFFFNFFTTKK